MTPHHRFQLLLTACSAVCVAVGTPPLQAQATVSVTGIRYRTGEEVNCAVGSGLPLDSRRWITTSLLQPSAQLPTTAPLSLPHDLYGSSACALNSRSRKRAPRGAPQFREWLSLLKPAVGIEPTTARLQIECSTTELRRRTSKDSDSATGGPAGIEAWNAVALESWATSRLVTARLKSTDRPAGRIAPTVGRACGGAAGNMSDDAVFTGRGNCSSPEWRLDVGPPAMGGACLP
jgi:hypothetical protein